MTRHRHAFAAFLSSLFVLSVAVLAQHGEPSGSTTRDGSREPGVMDEGYQPRGVTPFLYHERHLHAHNRRHLTVAPDGTRFFTTRESSVLLPLPGEQDAFVFAVFGDRTGGPDLGINVLADAVRDVNLIEPDLVMTVGDMPEATATLSSTASVGGEMCTTLASPHSRSSSSRATMSCCSRAVADGSASNYASPRRICSGSRAT